MSVWLARAIASQRCLPPVPLVSLAPVAPAQAPGSAPTGANDAIDTGVPILRGTSSLARLILAADPAAEPLTSAADWLAYFEERAAIREFEGGFSRSEAEQLADAETTAALGPLPQPSAADRTMP